MRKLLASLCFIFALCANVQAQECNAVAPQLEHAKAVGWEAIKVDGDDLRRLVANYNAAEPKSDLHPTVIWILHDKNGDPNFVNVAFVNGECIEHVDVDVPTKAVIEYLITEPGDPA